MIDAVLSSNRKAVLCGACGRMLCRRSREAAGPLRIPGSRAYMHDLSWDVDWHVVDGHIERSEAAMDRLDKGWSPIRRGWYGEDRERSRGFPERQPARCPWATCDAINRIDPKRLDVD